MMKINPGWRSMPKDVLRPDLNSSQQVAHKSFSDMMQQQDEQADQQQLRKKLNEIQIQGERLTKSMTIRELRAYKLLVRQFLEETARRGIQLKETRGWDRRGRGKKYRLLEEIDKQLLDMADDMLQEEQGRVELLQRVGEIRGLLINFLY